LIEKNLGNREKIGGGVPWIARKFTLKQNG